MQTRKSKAMDIIRNHALGSESISVSSDTSTSDWQRLDVYWHKGKSSIQEGIPQHMLAPTWQMLLLGDGSTTRHLQLLTGEPIKVEVVDMSQIGMNTDRAPELILELPGPRLRRQVWLQTASGQRLAYATSWWEASHVDRYLRDRALPIGSNLANLRMEFYRDICEVFLGDSEALEAGFGYPGPYWGRYCLFWHNGKPLTLIYEVFSPYLDLYLGQSVKRRFGKKQSSENLTIIATPSARAMPILAG
jgi:chorismate lyase